MKYLAALLIGIGLLAHNPASAEKLEFFFQDEETRVEDCYKAAKRGIPIGAKKTLERTGKPIEEHFLVNRGDFGVWDGTGNTALWRIYHLEINPKPFGWIVSCRYKPLEE